MTRTILITAAAALLLAAPAWGQSGAELENEQQRVSYAIGADIAERLTQRDMNLDTEVLVRGIRDTMEGNEMLLSAQERKQVLNAFRQRLRSEQQARMKAEAEANLKEGQAFLEENKDKDGVQTTDSGLQYRVLNEGDGAQPDANDVVTTHYRGKLLDGTEFDSSYKRGQPAEFPVSGVIRGWTEALQLMQEGGKYRIWVPADLAYGERGTRGGPIGPNETLVFDIELLEVKAREGSGQPQGQGRRQGQG